MFVTGALLLSSAKEPSPTIAFSFSVSSVTSVHRSSRDVVISPSRCDLTGDCYVRVGMILFFFLQFRSV